MEGMLKNPFTEERQNKLREDAEDLLSKFSGSYVSGFLRHLVSGEMKKASGGKPADQRRLNYRKWNSMPRPNMFAGSAFLREGLGQGDFGRWNRYYFVEQNDYTLNYFKDEKAYHQGKAARGSIQLAGYSLEENPRQFYQNQLNQLKQDMKRPDEQTNPVGYSKFCFALTHQNRTNFLFQLHEAKNPTCGCFGGESAVEPESVGAELESERREWIAYVKRALKNAKGRSTSSYEGKAFTSALNDVTMKLSSLSKYDGDGSEPQVLTDLLVLHAVKPLRNEILGDLQETPFKLAVTMAYKTTGVISKILKELIGKAWTALVEQIEKLRNKILPTLKEIFQKIADVKKAVREKLKSLVIDKISELIKTYVKPVIEFVCKNFKNSLQNGFDQVSLTFQENTCKLPAEPKQTATLLNAVPRTDAKVESVTKCSQQLAEPISKLQELFPEVLSQMKPEKLQSKSSKLFLETLDAAMYTFQKEMKKNSDAVVCQQEVIEKLKHDSQVAQNFFIKDVLSGLVTQTVKKKLSEAGNSPVNAIDAIVPSEISNVVSAGGLVDELIEFCINEPIEKMVDEMYPVTVAATK